jgi:hypothetical protein
MDESILSQPAPRTAAQCKAAIADLLEEMSRIDRRMEQNRVEINRLTAETEMLKGKMRSILAGLETA